MAHLTPDTVLRRVPDIVLTLGESGQVDLRLGDLHLKRGSRLLAILDLFAHPRSVGDALHALKAVGAEDYVEASSLLLELHRCGVLVDALQPMPRVTTRAYAAPAAHVAMLNDRARTAGFLRAVREVVAEGDVVVDIGTGTAVLAVAAARAGARHVYAIEESRAATAARGVIADNGLSHRITVLDGRSTQIVLPERADVLVSELIGNDPLGERLLEITSDARRRFLKAGARLIPSSLTVFALPVNIPSAFLARTTFLDENTRDWREWYGIDFSSLSTYGRQVSRPLWVRPQDAKGWDLAGDPIVIAKVSLTEDMPLALQTEVELVLRADADRLGLLLYFDAGLSSKTTLSTQPSQADRANHWRSPLWFVAHPRPLLAGSTLRVAYAYSGGESVVGVT